MEIVDFHVHAGNFSLLREDIQGLLTKFPYEEGVRVEEIFSVRKVLKKYLESQGVVRAVILAECGPGTNYSIDSAHIAEFCSGDSFFVPFGSINPNYHEDMVAEWDRDYAMGIKGYKFYPADHDYDPFTDDMMAIYKKCELAGQPIMFHTGLTAQREASQKFIRPGEYRILAETFPNLTIVFAHGGKPHWYEEALNMAIEYEGVYLDTALVPADEVAKWLDHDARVVQKILFGSDLPVCGAYSAVVEKLRNADVSSTSMEYIASKNALRVLR